MEWLFDSIYHTRFLLFTSWHFYRGRLSNCTQNAGRYWVPSHHMKFNALLQKETHIAAEVVHNLPLIIYDDLMPSSTSNLLFTSCHFYWGRLSNCTQNVRLGVPSSDAPCAGNETIYCKERYPLLLKCFIALLRCMSKMGGASDSIFEPLMVQTVSFLLRSTLKLHTKYLSSLHWKGGWYTTRVVAHCCWSGSKASFGV